MKYIIIFGLFSLCSCTKEDNYQAPKTKKVFIQIDAVDNNNQSNLSKIILIN